MLLILGVLTLLNIIWVLNETRPPHWDMARHLLYSVTYWDFLRHGKLLSFILSYRYYPPFLYWSTLPFYAALGAKEWVSVLANNLIFGTTLLFSTYYLGKQLWNRKVGLLAAIVVITTPMIASQFREYQIDASLTAIVTLFILLLIKSNNFRETKYTIAIGIVAAIGMLDKWTFILAVLPVLLMVTIPILWFESEQRKQALKNFLVSFAIGYIVVSPWYWTNIRSLASDLKYNAVQAGGAEGDPAIRSVASITWYLKNILNNQLYLIPTLLFITGLATTFKRETLKKNLPLILTIVGNLIIFTLLRNKDARYTMPILSSVAIMATYWVFSLKPNVAKIIAGLIVIYCAFAFVTIGYNIKSIPVNINLDIKGQQYTLFGQHGYIIGQYTNEKWYQKEVVNDIANQPISNKTFTYIGPDTVWFNSWGFDYYNALQSVTKTDPINISTTNFVIVRRASADPTFNNPSFELQKTYPTLPDGTLLSLYAKK